MRNIFLAAAAAAALISGAANANIAHGVEGGPPPASVLEMGAVAGQPQQTQEQQGLQGNPSGFGAEDNGNPTHEQQ